MSASFQETTPDPSFTCEVCKISVRSAQKLLDHVNFSPLHKAALEGGSLSNSASATSIKSTGGNDHSAAHQRRIIYDGTKLFWRINETFEICIYEDAHCVTICVFQQQSTEKVPPLVLDLRRLQAALELDHHLQPSIHLSKDDNHHHQESEAISKYLLARIQAKKDTHGHISLFLQKLHDSESDPMQLLLLSYHSSLLGHNQNGLPTDLAVRRRHTYDEVKEAQKEVHDAARELKKARVRAENLSNLARMSLDAFHRRSTNVPQTLTGLSLSHITEMDARRKASMDWQRAFERVTLKNAVDHSKSVLNSFQ